MVDLSLVKSKNLWYVVGLIATDGNLSSDRRHLNITSKDEQLIRDVKKVLFLKNKITRKARGGEKEKKYFVLQFGDVKFYNYLLKIGLMPSKSLILGKINVPKKYFIDFLRGVIDGDGCIRTWVHKTNKNYQWSLSIISASPIFVKWFKKEIEDFFEVKGKIYGYKNKDRKNFLYTIKFGKFAAKIIVKKTYYKNCLCLKRKLKKVQECLKSENGLTKYGNVVSDWSLVK